MRRKLILSDWTEKFMIQNQSKSGDELWNSFKSEIHKIRKKLSETTEWKTTEWKATHFPKQLGGIPSWETQGCVPINHFLRVIYAAKVSYTGDGYHQKMF